MKRAPMEKIKIESGIPVPPKLGRWLQITSAWQIGDSVLLPNSCAGRSFRGATRKAGQTVQEQKVERGQDSPVRIWRIS